MPIYTGISAEAFRHPLDREAEQALRSLPGFDMVARKFVEFVYERPQYVFLLGNSIQVGPRQYGSVYQVFRECVRDLDVYPEPAFFVSQNPISNAFALGQEQPSIVLNSGLLDLLDEMELRAVIAHELGHLKCGHTTLIQMARWAMEVAFFIGDLTFGIGNILSRGMILGFYEWMRKAELSADRASLLVVDDLGPVMQTMMKLAGGSSKHAHELSLEEFLRQAERYQSLDQDNLNQVYKFLLYNNISQGVFLSHPFTVERVHYLQQWAKSEDYNQIRRGNYTRVGAQGSVNVKAEEQTSTAGNDVDNLRQQVEELQREIERVRRQRNES
ncbi:MAG TPA: M48 family metallopeptidase [Halomicronema sp.]